jgi:hypothetical protein
MLGVMDTPSIHGGAVALGFVGELLSVSAADLSGEGTELELLTLAPPSRCGCLVVRWFQPAVSHATRAGRNHLGDDAPQVESPLLRS